MTPEILAKIMGIIAKTGEKVIVIDPKTEQPFVVLGLDQYEGILSQGLGAPKGASVRDLTRGSDPGIIDPDLAIWRESKDAAQGDWGGDEATEEDRYYMEPTE